MDEVSWVICGCVEGNNSHERTLIARLADAKGPMARRFAEKRFYA